MEDVTKCQYYQRYYFHDTTTFRFRVTGKQPMDLSSICRYLIKCNVIYTAFNHKRNQVDPSNMLDVSNSILYSKMLIW